MKQNFAANPTPASRTPKLRLELFPSQACHQAEHFCPAALLSDLLMSFPTLPIGGISLSKLSVSTVQSDLHSVRWHDARDLEGNPVFRSHRIFSGHDCHGSMAGRPSPPSRHDYGPLAFASADLPGQPMGNAPLDTLRQAAESLAQQVAVLAPLVVRGEARRVGGLGDLALEDLLEGVGALARGRVDVAHQMHVGGCRVLLGLIEGFEAGDCGRFATGCAEGGGLVVVVVGW